MEKQWKKLKNGQCQCLICNKIYSYRGISSHILRIHIKNNKKYGGYDKGNVPWNKGLTKDTDERLKKTAETFKRHLKEGVTKASFEGKHHTDETKRKISIKLSLNNKGGRCKWYKVGNYNVQGTWERDIVLKMDELGIKWEKIGIGTKRFTFSYGIKHYTPDFYIEEIDKFLEIKGYWRDKDKEKMRIVIKENKILENKLVIIEKDLYKELKNSETKELFISKII